MAHEYWLLKPHYWLSSEALLWQNYVQMTTECTVCTSRTWSQRCPRNGELFNSDRWEDLSCLCPLYSANSSSLCSVETCCRCLVWSRCLSRRLLSSLSTFLELSSFFSSLQGTFRNRLNFAGCPTCSSHEESTEHHYIISTFHVLSLTRSGVTMSAAPPIFNSFPFPFLPSPFPLLLCYPLLLSPFPLPLRSRSP